MIKFKRNHSDSANEIQTKLESGQLKDAERLAHTIEGVAGNLEAGELQKTAGALEKGIKERKKDQYQGLLENFAKSLNKALDCLKKF